MDEQIVETKSCTHCWMSFDITDKDLEFYDKISPIFAGKKYSIPNPTLCPDCRQQRRLAFRNERKLYKRKCDITGKDIVSIYSPDAPYKVYDQKSRRSDGWDPMSYGQDVDIAQSFFQQFDELFKKVPRIALNGHISNENSEYVNYVVQSKNCYMCFGGWFNENILYSTVPMYSKECCDIHFCFSCEQCYEITYCRECFNIQNGYNCEKCRDSYFIENCEWCNNCFACDGLVNQSYHIYNEKVAPEIYKQFIDTYISSAKKRNEVHQKVHEFFLKTPKKNLDIVASEDCIGNHISHSKECNQCYTVENVENAKQCNTILNMKNAHDSNQVGVNSEWLYEMMTCSMNITNCKFSLILRNNCSNLLYCSDMNSCTDCFGCIGLRDKQYCILNKQYTKEEYEQLVSKIIEKMIIDKERWEFFPATISPFGYNETVANELYLLTKDGALKDWFHRCEYEAPFPKVEKILKADQLPEISLINDDILHRAIECEVTKKPFRIIKPELEFYRKHNLSLPCKHPDQRHKERMELRNPIKLRDRTCAKCWVAIQTTYVPQSKEAVYCETCYNKEIYW